MDIVLSVLKKLDLNLEVLRFNLDLIRLDLAQFLD